MPDGRRVTCQSCRRHRAECGEISWRGKCAECGPRIAVEAATQLHYHSGPVFDRWRVRIAASVGAILADELEALAAALPDDG